MTCKEKYIIDYPTGDVNYAISEFCPSMYYKLDNPEYCNDDCLDGTCKKLCVECWNREIPEEDDDVNINNIPYIKDSGARREFETGAVRDIHEGKGRCDLLPLDAVSELYRSIYGESSDSWYVLNRIEWFVETGEYEYLLEAISDANIFKDPQTIVLEVSKHFEEGCKKYGENNWQKGIPTHCYIDSAVRHYLKYLRGDKDEPHDRAFYWNILCCIWTCIHKPELNNYRKKENNDDT